jgi:TonB family protein
MKKFLVCFCLIVSVTSLHAQVEKIYYDENWRRVSADKSVHYQEGHRVVVTLASGAKDTVFVDSVKTYYTASTKIRSKIFFNQQGMAHGGYTEYFENGRIKERGIYNQGQLSKHNYGFYPDGKAQFVFFYAPADPDPFQTNRIIFAYWDSLGIQLVKDGNGTCKCYFDETVREDGQVASGFRDGTWSIYHDNRLANKEVFDKGRFVSGIAYTSDGEISYTSFEIAAEFKGGLQGLGKFLSNNLRYPVSDRRMGIEGQVFVAFVIEKDGSISDANVVKGISRTADAEAVRVVNASNGKWIPGRQRGHTVRSRFVLPIRFILN